MPSSYEGFGIALMEAMAIGIPTLVSKISTFLAISNDSSQFFDLKNQKDFINNLNLLIDDHMLRVRNSNKGRLTSEEISRKKNYVDKLGKLYKSLVNVDKK
jgi:glycosyltransferase involved in cell wall biosynthesis